MNCNALVPAFRTTDDALEVDRWWDDDRLLYPSPKPLGKTRQKISTPHERMLLILWFQREKKFGWLTSKRTSHRTKLNKTNKG
jgi:hypothetical protein